MKRNRQGGVALLTVLLLVAVMTVLVMSVLDDIRFGLRRAANSRAVAQAQRYALGAEVLARTRIQRLARRDGARTTLAGDWNNQPFVFPIGDPSSASGVIRARMWDNTTCFNLNSVVEGAGEQWQRRELGVRQFVALLQALDFSRSDADALADALVDWIDSDHQRSAHGAEDAHYMALGPGYRTAGTLLAEPSELRAIAGFDSSTYAQLRPQVCALPSDELSPVNINTLTRDDAPILTMLTLGHLDRDAARAVIAARPSTGWQDFESFWSLPALSGFVASQPLINQIQLRTRYFGLHVQVQYGDAQVVLSALFKRDDAGRTALVARRWSNNE